MDDDEINEFLAALSMETGGEISHDDLIGLDSLFKHGRTDVYSDRTENIRT